MNQLKFQQKRLLRQSVKAALSRSAQDSIDSQSKEIIKRVQTLPEFKAAKGICCYLSMPSGEVSTISLARSIVNRKDEELFVPRIRDKKESVMDCLKIYDEEDLISLPSGTWGIKEPGLTWNKALRENALEDGACTLDLILVPGVAFDRSFSRLGHGKGYYDRFISSYIASGRRRPYLVGLSLREQLLDAGAIPMAEHDWSLDAIVTPDEILTREVQQSPEATSSSVH